jgi:hypothetical protein
MNPMMTPIVQTDFAGVTRSASFDGAGDDSIPGFYFSDLRAHFDDFSAELMPGNYWNLNRAMPSHEGVVANGHIRPAEPGCGDPD